jgi:LysR family transcriptional regulator, transcriptional activator AphB
MKSKPSLDDLQLFHSIVQQGSLRTAATALKIPIATLSRRLQKLEQSLGCRLLERGAHHFALTEIGQHYFAACGPLLSDLHAVTEQLDAVQHELSGQLKITAPVNLTQQWLGRCFFDFMRRYPNIRLQLIVSNQNENLIEQQLDAAIRVGDPQHGAWIARPIWKTHLGLCASSEYLRRSPLIEHPRDLNKHSIVIAQPMSDWQLTHQHSGENFTVHAQPYFSCSDIGVALDAAANHFGIVLVPNYYFAEGEDSWRTSSRNLAPVLADWQGQPRPVYLMYRDREVMSARLRVFIDHVMEWMANRTQRQQP